MTTDPAERRGGPSRARTQGINRSSTGRPRRGRPAQASRRLLGGASVAVVLGLVAGWSATPAPPAASPPVDLRVVITDPAIDPDAAVAAALDAAARGVDRVQVPLAGPRTPIDRQARDVPHTTSRAS